MKKKKQRIKRLESGQGLVEFALLIAIIIAGSLIGLAATGTSTMDLYCSALGILNVEPASCQAQDLLAENFDIFDAWNITSGKHWELVAGKLFVGPGGEHRAFTGDENWEDYTINIADAVLDRGNGYGVYFRVSEEPDINGYAFQYDPGYQQGLPGGGKNGAFIIRKIVDGRELWPPLAVEPAPVDYEWRDISRKVSVQLDGDTFTAYIDDQEVVQATDDSYSEGRIGLHTWGGSEASFDGLTVTQP
ncbi:MAG: DUF1080 domain-containing protein [Anaerolineales bacterium]|nr:DUF1080 domain-containing protein [Anaerolineales bacterium]